MLRDAGLPLLIEHAARPARSHGVARALTAYVCDEAATALAGFAGHRAAHPILRAYLAQHPMLAPRAIAPLLAASDRTARSGARALFASLAAATGG